MSKPDQVLQLQPTEIVLKGPFDDLVEAQLNLSNPLLDEDVYYKVKTTASKFYCVRPSSGVIKPRDQTTIKIILQPTDFNELLQEKSRHKFLIQSYIAQTEDEKQKPVERFWKEIDTSKIMDTKLRVTFLAENGEPLETADQLASFLQTPKTASGELTQSRKRNEQFNRTGASFEANAEEFPMIYVILFCVFAVILGLVIGKAFFLKTSLTIHRRSSQ